MKNTVQNRVIELKNRPRVIASAACVGKNEGEGPLSAEYDIVYPDDGIGQQSWENAESELLFQSVSVALQKAKLNENDVGLIFAGDLINQCTSSTYAIRGMNIPFAGLFGACSTMAYALALSCLFINGGYGKYALAATCSHFCSAEKQFRYPLEYGSQRPPCAQRTVTGAGAYVIGKEGSGNIYIPRALFGKITDLGINDTSNMGAAMAPAAADSIASFLRDTDTVPSDYDMILTGDLGKVGSDLLVELLRERERLDISSVHNDCGLMIYDLEKQDVDSGGSGCGCSAAVTASYIMRLLSEKKLKKVLFAGTGALMSPLISLQGETIPAICHIVEFDAGGDWNEFR